MKGTILELGPDPGQFTELLRRLPPVHVVAVDLSRVPLHSARRRASRQPSLAPVDWVEAAGECLRLVSHSIHAAVVLGDIIWFAAVEGPAVLKEIARVTKRGSKLLLDFSSPVPATREYFRAAAVH